MLDKLEGIRGNLVWTDDDWREWDFPQLVEALRKWTERNPLKQDDRATEKPAPVGSQWHKRSKPFQAKQREWKPRACVYCEGPGHKASDCNKVVSVDERKKILSEKLHWYWTSGGRVSLWDRMPVLQKKTSYIDLWQRNKRTDVSGNWRCSHVSCSSAL